MTASSSTAAETGSRRLTVLSMVEEVAYQTTGIAADTSGGGVRVNMVPKDGGNDYHGTLFFGGSTGAWQSNNLSQSLKDRGLRLVGTSSHKGTPAHDADLTQPLALFIGNEGAGLPREVTRELDQSIAIPHSDHVESLNAGVATAGNAAAFGTGSITVNGISPGPFATEMNKPLLENPELNAQFLANIPLGRWGKVEEIGQLALYLCSEDAGFITGTDLLIDGGYTASHGPFFRLARKAP